MRLFRAILFLALCAFGWSESSFAGYLYFSEIGGTVSRANLDGSNVEPISASGFTARDITLDLTSDKLYGTFTGDIIGRSNLDGSDFESLVTGVGSAAWGIDLDLVNGLIYWADRDAGAIFRTELDGSNTTQVLSTGRPRGVQVDPSGEKIYWADDRGGAQAILRSNLDGSSIETIVSGIRPQFLDLDFTNGYMYWTDFEQGTITRTALDGTSSLTLISGLSNPKDIELDLRNNQIYWADSGSGSIRRANLDGSGIETLISGLNDPSGIALDLRPVVPEPSSVALFGLGSIGIGFIVRRRKRHNDL